jgi:hypothetical protein
MCTENVHTMVETQAYVRTYVHVSLSIPECLCAPRTYIPIGTMVETRVPFSHQKVVTEHYNSVYVPLVQYVRTRGVVFEIMLCLYVQ